MTLDVCIKNIARYLRSEDPAPRVVNVKSVADLQEISERFNVGDNQFVAISEYAKEDEMPNFEKMEYDLSCRKGSVFITGLSTQLKLHGERALESTLDIFKTGTYVAHIVVLCYQCENYLSHWGTRERRLVYCVDGESSKVPEIIFVTPERSIISQNSVQERIVVGIQNVASAIESMDGGKLVVKTKKHQDNYSNSLIAIKSMEKPYDALCAIDPRTNVLEQKYGSEKQWNYALQAIEKSGSWSELIKKTFSIPENLGLVIGNYSSANELDKWLYFIALKLYGAGNNKCLQIATNNADDYKKLPRCIYRSMLDMDPCSIDFWTRYSERKDLIKKIGDPEKEILDYLMVLKSKEDCALYYLTDNTQNEKEFIFEILARYPDRFTFERVGNILKYVYPDLYAYLQPYRFKNDFLDRYFQDYKYQKITNRIMPGFAEEVEQQARERDFNRWLAPRSEVVDRLDTQGARCYFVDAMGVEYLGFILSKCKDKELMADVSVCRCELPSLTVFNKEFLEHFSDIAPDIKRLDNIKHHGAEGFDYLNKKLPVHLIQELKIVEEVLDDIRKRLSNGDIERAYMIADHGASRLAVINEHEAQWEMQEKGKHCGRCCPISDADVQSEFATEARGFWVLANYDRFKGSRPGSVEVHGGATLEEVTVPVIELTYMSGELEVSIETPLPIEVSFRKKARLILFSKTKLGDVTVRINGKRVENQYYDAVPIGGNKYSVDMPEVKFAGTYQMTVYSNSSEVVTLPFTVKKEGASERSIL